MIQSLTSFTVTADYGRTETTFDVRTAGQPAPVVRLYKAGPYGRRPLLYQVLAGPRFTEPVGFVSPLAAWTTDRGKLGSVEFHFRRLRSTRWQVHQDGLPTLVSRPIGFSAMRYVFPLSLVLTDSTVDHVLPFRFDFRAPGSDGFVVSRPAGFRPRFDVTVRDSRLDRRVVLACVLGLSTFQSEDVRRDVVDLTTNPFTS